MRGFEELIESEEYKAFSHDYNVHQVIRTFDRLDKSRETKRISTLGTNYYGDNLDECMTTYEVCTDITVGYDRHNNSIILTLYGNEYAYYYWDKDEDNWLSDYSCIEWTGWDEC